MSRAATAEALPQPASASFPIGGRARLALLALSLCVFVPGMWSVGLIDRDEGWYAQVSREMLATGEWLIPTYLGEPWIAKPPLLYWCVASSFAVFGETAGAARLPVVIAALLSVQLIATLGARLFSRRAGIIAAACFATAGLPAIVQRILLTDSLLLVWILGACLLLLRFVARRGLWSASGFWLCVGLGVLTKGPAVFVFVGAFALALLLRREARRAAGDPRIWITLPVALVVGGWWYVVAAHDAGATLWQQFIGYEILDRLHDAPRGHTGPIGYYLAIGAVGWLPWSVLVIGAVVELARDWRRDAAASLVLIWWLLPWVTLELIDSKLPHYILPAFVPIALMLGRMWDRGLARKPDRVQTVVLWIWWGLLLALLCGLAGVGLAFFARPGAVAAVVIGVLLAGALVATTARYLKRGALDGVLWSVVGVMGVFYALFCGWLLPQFESQRVSVLVAEAANRAVARFEHDGAAVARWGDPTDAEQPRVLVSGYAEPTVFFYLDVRGETTNADELRGRARTARRVVIAAQAALDVAGLAPDANWQRVEGLNYVKGERVVVWVGLTTPRGEATTQPARGAD